MTDQSAKDKADYYALLGVQAYAPQDEIKSAYRALARRYHPDANRGDTQAADMFRRITEAYDVIGDPERRTGYDRWRRDNGLVVEPPLKFVWTPSRRSLPNIHEMQVLYALVEIGMNELKPAETRRAALNMCLIVDRSTSMQGRRMDQIKAAATRIIDDLKPDDTLSIVTFSDRAEVVLPASEKLDKNAAKSRVMSIQPAGGTEILSGLVSGLSEVMQMRRMQGVNHIILLTDGRTYGDESASVALAEEAGADGVGISAIGIGHDWNDKFLDLLASKTGGTSAYIESADEVGQFLQKRILGLGAARATDLRLALETDGRCKIAHAFKVSPFAQELIIPDKGPLMLGALEGTAPLSLILELHVSPHSEEGYDTLVSFELRATLAGAVGKMTPLTQRLRLEFTPDAPEEAPPPNIISALGKLTVHRLQERAYQAAEAGDSQAATRSLETLATRLMALGQPELAQAALSEADRLARTGVLSGEARMRLKYGTRSLISLPPPRPEN